MGMQRTTQATEGMRHPLCIREAKTALQRETLQFGDTFFDRDSASTGPEPKRLRVSIEDAMTLYTVLGADASWREVVRREVSGLVAIPPEVTNRVVQQILRWMVTEADLPYWLYEQTVGLDGYALVQDPWNHMIKVQDATSAIVAVKFNPTGMDVLVVLQLSDLFARCLFSSNFLCSWRESLLPRAA